MGDGIKFTYVVDGNDFTIAGENSSKLKRELRRLGVSPDVMRRVAIAMYEAEINMVIHAGGGVAEVIVSESYIDIILEDHGPGIKDIDQAMQPGYSTSTEQIRSLGFGAGMGLPNMKKNTDSMEITTKIGVGTRIAMRVNL